MVSIHWFDTSNLLARFRDDRGAAIAPIAALALIPIMTAVGATVDYSRANNVRSKLQSALDAGLLAGARENTPNWDQMAKTVFEASLKASTSANYQISKAFVQDTGQIFKGNASTVVPTAFLGLINIHSMKVAVTSTATASEADNSCILTLDKGQPKSHVSLSLNGAPVVNLSGCSIRSNTSIDCNGHDGNVTKALGAGSADGCSNPKPGSSVVPDIYAPLASKITPACGTSHGPGVNWSPGSIPATGAGFKIVTGADGRTEYHVCGDLTLKGSGALLGAPSSDALIVIENGDLEIEDKASISIARTAVVMTGNNNYNVSNRVIFPTGNGKEATLKLSPPLDPGNHWHGVALYQDPKLTKNVDNTWGPGSDFSADGLVYLGNSNVVQHGDTSSNNAKCSKFVMNQFTSNGHVNLDFNQTVASCAAIGLKQWGGIIVHLMK